MNCILIWLCFTQDTFLKQISPYIQTHSNNTLMTYKLIPFNKLILRGPYCKVAVLDAICVH